MKKILWIIFLSLFCFNISFAKNGYGKISLSDNVIRDFQRYISDKQEPVIFLVTEDGKGSVGWFCPYSQCMPTGSSLERQKCEEYYMKKCYRLATRRVIVWKNEFTKKANRSEKSFRKKDDFMTIKNKLTKLGLVGDIFETESTNTKIEDNKDVVKKLKALNELYKSGALTKEEFTKAKNKLLN